MVCLLCPGDSQTLEKLPGSRRTFAGDKRWVNAWWDGKQALSLFSHNCVCRAEKCPKSLSGPDSNLKLFLTHFLQRLASPKATPRSKTNLELIFQHGVWCQHQLWQKELRNLMPITRAFQLEDPTSNSPPHRRKKATETVLSNRASFFEPCHYNINIACALIYWQITTEQPPALVLKETTNSIQLCISSKNPPTAPSHNFRALCLGGPRVSPPAFFLLL